MMDRKDPLSWLRARGMVSAEQYAAALKLSEDFAIATSPIGSGFIRYPGRRPRQAAPQEMVLEAHRRFNRALLEVGPGLDSVINDVCFKAIGLEEIEKANGWPARSAKVVLSIALDRLALHYGIYTTIKSRKGRIRACISA